MDLLDVKRIQETDFFKIWNWHNQLNKEVGSNPSFFKHWILFYSENVEMYQGNEKLQDIISINKVKTRFYNNGKDLTEEMIQCFTSDSISNISIRMAFEDNIRFNSKIISKLVKRDYTLNGAFNFNNFIRRSLSFTDFVLKNKDIFLDQFQDVDQYKRQDFVFEADPDLNIALKLKRYGFPHQSFYNFLNEENKAIPRKKFLVHLSYFFQFTSEMMEILMKQHGYTIENSSHLLDEIILHCFEMGVSFDNIKIISNYYGFNF